VRLFSAVCFSFPSAKKEGYKNLGFVDCENAFMSMRIKIESTNEKNNFVTLTTFHRINLHEALQKKIKQKFSIYGLNKWEST